MYVDRYTVRVVGDVIAHGGSLLDGSKRTGHPVVSQYDLRQKSKKHDHTSNPWTREFFAQDLSPTEIKERAVELSAAKAIAEEDIKEPRRKTKDLQCTQTKLHRAVNTIKCPDRFATETYEKFRSNRENLHSARIELSQQEEALRDLKRELYYFNKLDKADKSSPPKNLESSRTMTTPTWDRFTVEDDVRHLDIKKLATSDGRSIVFSGTDYGVCTMSQTVALSSEQVSEHFNYYFAMSGKSLLVDCPIRDAWRGSSSYRCFITTLLLRTQGSRNQGVDARRAHGRCDGIARSGRSRGN